MGRGKFGHRNLLIDLGFEDRSTAELVQVRDQPRNHLKRRF
jgi:hypothetical protein